MQYLNWMQNLEEKTMVTDLILKNNDSNNGFSRRVQGGEGVEGISTCFIGEKNILVKRSQNHLATPDTLDTFQHEIIGI